MAQHVLVPYDDSQRSTDALDFAIEAHPDSTITAVHVIDPSDFYAATGMEGGAMANYDAIIDHQNERAENLLREASDRAADAGVDIRTDHVIGSVSRSIIDYVEEHDVDHVVIGSHGRTGARRILLGSVAETVARRSPVPVTIVR
ncbi:universal stress protein [Halovivax gelatinilyticus]|uniref:universal stress protein n=1 Tax=Halovivax gelatinilyticus TaxID=2961597 RepID=UPI0020CA9298|nr:universal stress protein [Halovivax gelatinilyticus]